MPSIANIAISTHMCVHMQRPMPISTCVKDMECWEGEGEGQDEEEGAAGGLGNGGLAGVGMRMTGLGWEVVSGLVGTSGPDELACKSD